MNKVHSPTARLCHWHYSRGRGVVRANFRFRNTAPIRVYAGAYFVAFPELLSRLLLRNPFARGFRQPQCVLQEYPRATARKFPHVAKAQVNRGPRNV